MKKMKKVILAEISTLETSMQTLYGRLITMHKAVVHLYDFQ